MQKRVLQKVLLVDPDPHSLKIEAYCLERLKRVTVKTLSSLEETPRESSLFHPDLILLDTSSNEAKALEVIKILKSESSLASIPIALLCEKFTPDKWAEFKKIGILDVLIKPIEPLSFPSQVEAIWNASS